MVKRRSWAWLKLQVIHTYWREAWDVMGHFGKREKGQGIFL